MVHATIYMSFAHRLLAAYVRIDRSALSIVAMRVALRCMRLRCACDPAHDNLKLVASNVINVSCIA